MATTDVTLYRSLMGETAKLRVRDGDRHARSALAEHRLRDRDGNKKVSRGDVRIVRGTTGPEVDNNGKGTSLHDVSGWSPPASS